MARFLLVLAACIVLPLVSYAAVAVVAWSVWPGEWTDLEQSACALFALVLTGIGIRLILEWTGNE